MSKANRGHIMPGDSNAISRRSMLKASSVLAAGSATAISPMIALAATGNAEHPEFRSWYALMREDEDLFRPGNTIGESGTHDDDRHKAIVDRMSELRSAIFARPATAPVHDAILAILALHAAERGAECIDRTGQFRFLTLGATQMGDGSENFDVRVGMTLIEKTLRRAVAQNLLPGVTIYGDGGNS